MDHDQDGELSGLYVHKDYVGKGIGKHLLKLAENSIEKLGCKQIILQSTVTAKDFYKKHGYRVIKKALHPIGDKNIQL
ncbi:MAG: GNAT family N-acetyltransferase [Candidatus Peregrinibacteria bacterium]|nr:GNAT family N-acetyltransferase [Candidatus Peregrinibacteria bacterium]